MFSKPLNNRDPNNLTPPGSSSSTETGGSTASRQQSLVVVDWNGPDDPEKPLNWSRAKKNAIISSVCLMRFTTYVMLPLIATAIDELTGL